jgi:hypothetical protein
MNFAAYEKNTGYFAAMIAERQPAEVSRENKKGGRSRPKIKNHQLYLGVLSVVLVAAFDLVFFAFFP